MSFRKKRLRSGTSKKCDMVAMKGNRRGCITNVGDYYVSDKKGNIITAGNIFTGKDNKLLASYKKKGCKADVEVKKKRVTIMCE